MMKRRLISILTQLHTGLHKKNRPFCVILVMMLTAQTAWAQVTCSWDDGTKTLTISGSGELTSDLVYDHHYDVKSVFIGSGVTSIDENTFDVCEKLESINVDGNNQNFTSEDGVLFDKDKTTLVRYPRGKSGTSYLIPASVTTIENNAFSGCSSLTSMAIPASVTSIGGGAFFGCTNLAIVIVQRYHSSGESPITTLGANAFDYYDALTIYVPNDAACTAYKSASNWSQYANKIQAISRDSYSGYCGDPIVNNGKNVYYAYYQNDIDEVFLIIAGSGTMKNYYGEQPWIGFTGRIKTVNIGDGVTSIGSNAFYGCSSLPSITIPASVTSIGERAFWNCINLTSFTIPVSVTSIGEYAFNNCKELTSITIPASVTSIYGNTFNECKKLESINVDGNNQNYTSEDGVLFDKDKTTLVRYPQGKSGTSYLIPASVTTIGSNAFSGCSSLTSVTIPNSVTSIGSDAFKNTGWYNNQSDGLLYLNNWLLGYKGSKPTGTLQINEGTKGIAGRAFYGCSSLTSVSIPASVTSIGNSAFKSSALQRIYVLRSESVPTLGDDVFENCNENLAIVVPAAVKSNYATATGWSTNSTKLKDGYTVTCSTGITFTTTNNGPLVEQDETVTLSGTGTIPDGYAFAGYSVTKDGTNPAETVTVTEASGVYSFTMPASDVTVSAVFEAIPWSGTGISTDPYIIEYPSQLDLLATRVNSGESYYQKFFKLGADITYAHTTEWNDASSTENNYTAIGKLLGSDPSANGFPFRGTFDGDGHTVSGIRIYKDGNDWTDAYQGLFGYIEDATVKNVTVADARITGKGAVGGIVGIASFYSDPNLYGTIENCHVLSDVTIHAVVNDANSHGGIAGGNYGIIRNCTSAATLTVKDGVTGCEAFGGIVGNQAVGVTSNNLAVGVTMPAVTKAGAICGRNQGGPLLEYNYYSNCAVGTATSDIGCDGADIPGDFTVPQNPKNPDGAVPATATRYGAITMIQRGTKKHAIIDGNYPGDDVTSIPSDTDVDWVTFNRTFPADKYCTIVLPFEINTSYLTGVDYVLSFAGMTYDENGMLTYMAQIVWDKSQEHVYLQPYTPYMVLTNRSRLSINNIPVIFESTREAFTEKDGWEFRGVTAYTIWDATHNNALLGRVYGFAATSGKATDGVTDVNIGDFVRAEAGAYTYPLRAYLLKKEISSTAPHRTVALDELPDRIPVRIVDKDGGTTEITTTNYTNFTNSDKEWYTINGVKLSAQPTQKGVYIHRGRKEVVK